MRDATNVLTNDKRLCLHRRSMYLREFTLIRNMISKGTVFNEQLKLNNTSPCLCSNNLAYDIVKPSHFTQERLDQSYAIRSDSLSKEQCVFSNIS